MTDKSAYERKLDAKLEEWNAEIDRLKAQAKEASADTEIEIRQQIDELQDRRDDARSRLEKVKDSSNEAWEDVKAGADKAWDEMQASFEKAKARFS